MNRLNTVSDGIAVAIKCGMSNPMAQRFGQSRPKHILLLDADVSVRNSLDSLLRSENYCVVSTGDDEEALHQLSKHPIDLALVDLKHSDEDRWRMVGRLDAANPRLPIILLTTQSAPPAHPLASRAQAWFSKPLLDLPSLFAKVSELTAGSIAALG